MKNMLRRLLLPLTLMTTAALTGCATYTDVREHKDLAQISPTIQSVVILPPDVAIQKINFTGENEILKEKQDQIAKTLTDNLAQQLRKAKLDVKPLNFAEASANNADFAYAVTQCKKAFDEAGKSLYAKPVEVKNKAGFSQSIGGLGNDIAETAGADAFVIVKYDGFEKSGGMIAKDIAAGILIAALTGGMPVSPQQGSAVSIGIIAANSGEVLWTNRKTNAQLNAAVLDMALKEMPTTHWAETPAVNTAAVAPTATAATATASTATTASAAPAAAISDVTANSETPEN